MDTCSICLESINTNTTYTICNHKFHHSCLSTWIQNNNTCPLCRTQLIDNTPKIDILDRLLDLSIQEIESLSLSSNINITYQ